MNTFQDSAYFLYLTETFTQSQEDDYPRESNFIPTNGCDSSVRPKSAHAQTLRNDGDNLIMNSPPSAVCCTPCVHHLNLYSNQTLLLLFKEHTSPLG